MDNEKDEKSVSWKSQGSQERKVVVEMFKQAVCKGRKLGLEKEMFQ